MYAVCPSAVCVNVEAGVYANIIGVSTLKKRNKAEKTLKPKILSESAKIKTTLRNSWIFQHYNIVKF